MHWLSRLKSTTAIKSLSFVVHEMFLSFSDEEELKDFIFSNLTIRSGELVNMFESTSEVDQSFYSFDRGIYGDSNLVRETIMQSSP